MSRPAFFVFGLRRYADGLPRCDFRDWGTRPLRKFTLSFFPLPPFLPGHVPPVEGLLPRSSDACTCSSASPLMGLGRGGPPFSRPGCPSLRLDVERNNAVRASRWFDPQAVFYSRFSRSLRRDLYLKLSRHSFQTATRTHHLKPLGKSTVTPVS